MGKVTGLVAQILICRLQVAGYGIVNPSLNAAIVEFVSDSIAIEGNRGINSHHVEVVNMTGIALVLNRHDALRL